MSEHDPGASWPPPPAGGGRPAGYGSGYEPRQPFVPPPVPAPLPRFPHPEPRPYHLMLRTWNYRWWRPAVGVVIVVFGMFIIAPIVFLPVLALGVYAEGGPFWQKFQDAATLKTVDPAALLYLNLALGSMVFVTWFVMRVVHRMRPRWLMSVKPRIRWRFFFACLGLAVVALVAQLVVGNLLPHSAGTGTGGKLNHFTASSAAIAIIVIFTTPLQAAGEEYVFRGYLMQAFGSILGVHESVVRRELSKWTAILLTAFLFGLAHGAQNFPLFFDRFMFGLIAGYLVILTGGLEAGIALHILNNFLAFGVAVLYGDLTKTLTVSDASWWQIVLTLTQSGVYLGLVAIVARRMEVQTMTNPPPAASAGEQPAAVTAV
ncbi:MAG TPA: CPBP family intramembrane glutamic endopeptidase [Gemmatimonadales bacterium]|nr:CPBP family intramembrane glutamic endopeptidase [Gemmatimonadales bacterium]